MRTVLIIDDSPTETAFIQSILEEGDFEVLSAADAKSGIDMAIKHQPSLILMDIVMPGMSGFQATRQLRRTDETSAIPILILTTKDQETDKIWGIRNGANAYMCKPPSKEKLINEINRLIR